MFSDSVQSQDQLQRNEEKRLEDCAKADFREMAIQDYTSQIPNIERQIINDIAELLLDELLLDTVFGIERVLPRK